MTLASANSSLTGTPTPEAVTLFSRGLISQTFPSSLTATEKTLTSQSIFGTIIPLYLGQVVTNIVVCITTAASGTAPTAVFLGLYDLSGNKLGATADVKTGFGSATAGFNAFALSSAYTVTATGSYYAVFLKNGTYGSTDPKLLTGAAQPTGAGTALGSNAAANVVQTGQTTLGTTQTLAAADQGVWFGAS